MNKNKMLLFCVVVEALIITSIAIATLLKGYAYEAACACRDYAFNTLKLPAVYCYQKYTNVPSQKTAEKMGMKRIKQYPDEKNEFITVYAMTRETYLTVTTTE